MSERRLRVNDLSPDQKEAYDRIGEWVCDPGAQPILTLAGFGGTGKSTVISVFSSESTVSPIAYCAFTGKASSVLRRKLEAAGVKATPEVRIVGKDGEVYGPEYGSSIPYCGTIHGLIYTPIFGYGGKIAGFRLREELDRPYKLFIVDECFHYKQRVLTETGWQKIGTIVNKKIQCNVWSRDPKTGALELKPIMRWLKKPSPETLLRIDVGRTRSMHDARLLYCTSAHKILTPKGYVRAGSLKIGDELVVRGRHLTSLQFSVLVGSMLGDGSMNRNETRNSPQPVFMQGADQKSWLEFKKSIFGEDMTGPLRKGKSGYGDKDVWSFALDITDQARRVAEQMPFVGESPGGRRRWSPTDTFLSWIDAAALAVWYVDNGSLTGPQARLHTERFDEADHQRIIDTLKKTFSLSATMHPDSRGYFYLSFNNKETIKLLDIVRPYVPKCMSRKAPGADFKPIFVPASDTTTAPITSIKETIGRSRDTAYVYDLEVKDHHNYIAGNVVVSNCSMVTDDMLNDLRSFNIPILAVGDHGQLPPVRGLGSLMDDPDIRLEKIHRQAESNPIIRLGKAMRETGRFDRKLADGKAITFDSRSNLNAHIMRRYKGASIERVFELGTICYMNRTRIQLNLAARQARGFRGPPGVGEQVICLKNLRSIGVYNGMRGIITSEITRDKNYRWKINANVEFPEDGVKTNLNMFAEQFNKEKTFDSFDTIAQETNVRVKNWDEVGALFDFGSALTAHKSQGSGFQDVLLVVERPSMVCDDDFRRWCYTSISRAISSIVILT